MIAMWRESDGKWSGWVEKCVHHRFIDSYIIFIYPVTSVILEIFVWCESRNKLERKPFTFLLIPDSSMLLISRSCDLCLSILNYFILMFLTCQLLSLFFKVGEGLCPRGGDSSTTMSIQTAALGNEDDIFVGGSFESRVWDGHHFVNVYHVAHFDGKCEYVLCTSFCCFFLLDSPLRVSLYSVVYLVVRFLTLSLVTDLNMDYCILFYVLHDILLQFFAVIELSSLMPI